MDAGVGLADGGVGGIEQSAEIRLDGAGGIERRNELAVPGGPERRRRGVERPAAWAGRPLEIAKVLEKLQQGARAARVSKPDSAPTALRRGSVSTPSSCRANAHMVAK